MFTEIVLSPLINVIKVQEKEMRSALMSASTPTGNLQHIFLK